MVNGEPKGHIVPSRGLRQGDPLSPYLFLLCSKGLNGLIQHAIDGGDIQCFSLCKKWNKNFSFIFYFANDSLLFCRASMRDIQVIQGVLHVYEKASGQQINKEKTTLFFYKSVTIALKKSIKDLLGVLEIKQY